MAWNPNIPTITNRVQDDLDAIRENFQHLDQLAERVDELQTVSGLAPVAGELQVVSELAPYVQALLDSRIVEMGSNANGEYVRWENGLQMCLMQVEETKDINIPWGTLYYAEVERKPFPAPFVSRPWVTIGNVGHNSVIIGSREATSTLTPIVEVYRAQPRSDAEYVISYVAFGFWE